MENILGVGDTPVDRAHSSRKSEEILFMAIINYFVKILEHTSVG